MLVKEHQPQPEEDAANHGDAQARDEDREVGELPTAERSHTNLIQRQHEGVDVCTKQRHSDGATGKAGKVDGDHRSHCGAFQGKRVFPPAFRITPLANVLLLGPRGLYGGTFCAALTYSSNTLFSKEQSEVHDAGGVIGDDVDRALRLESQGPTRGRP
jgi:hypothetical protein